MALTLASRRKKKGTRQSVMNKRRKGVLARIIPWMRRFGVALAVCVSVVWAGSWLYLNGSIGRASDWTQDKILLATADMGFAVEDILVEGREYTDAQTLLAIVNIQKGDPLFSFDPQEAQALIIKLGWVGAAQVERRLPNTIYIGLQERRPLALWQSGKKVKLLDESGEVIVTGNLERFADLVLMMGADAPEHARPLLANIEAEEALAGRIETAKRVSGRRWELALKNGVKVQLPDEDIGLALRRLAQAHEESGLLDKDVIGIDMRESDRISVRTKPGTVQDYTANKGKDLKIEAKTGNNI